MKKILIIEDNPAVRENIAEILELADFDVKTACDGKEGVALINKELPDLVICDITMPELDGYGVLHILNKKESTRNIPFIYMTSKAEKSDIRKGMNLGADDYLTKPFDDMELLDAIEIRLKKSETAKMDFGQGLEGLNLLIDEATSVHNLSEIKNNRKTRLYRKKKDIFLEGDTPLSLMYIKNGRVKTYKTNEEGKELITGIYVEGDFFAYESLLEGVYGESATTLEDSELVLISKQDFMNLIYGNPDVSKKFIELLSHKVAKKENQLLDLAYSTVRQRTAKALIEVNKKFGQSDSFSFLNISREDLANMIGTATETAIRVLSDLKEEGLILIESGKIKIKDLKNLETAAEKHFLI
ncbi:MAG: response regulator [Ekhidna sp.]